MPENLFWKMRGLKKKQGRKWEEDEGKKEKILSRSERSEGTSWFLISGKFHRKFRTINQKISNQVWIPLQGPLKVWSSTWSTTEITRYTVYKQVLLHISIEQNPSWQTAALKFCENSVTVEPEYQRQVSKVCGTYSWSNILSMNRQPSIQHSLVYFVYKNVILAEIAISVE